MDQVCRTITNFSLALLVGISGGAVFYSLSLPLPWTLGAMMASAAVAIAGRGRMMPLPMRDFARPVIGVMAGSSFTPAVLASISAWWPAMAVLLVYTFVMLFLGWWVFTRIFRLDRTTAFFASAPGGLGELTLLGSSLGGDLRSLVLVHSIRVVVVVFSTPFLLTLVAGEVDMTFSPPPGEAANPDLQAWAILIGCAVLGYLLGLQFKIPGGVMIPALVLSAIAHATGMTHSAPPYWLVALVQVIIGTIAGSRFADVPWRSMLRVLLGGLAWALTLIAGALIAAKTGALLLDRPLPALLLAFMPGGMAEMTIISYAIGIEVAFVVTCQVCRLFAVYISAPILFKIASRSPPREHP